MIYNKDISTASKEDQWCAGNVLSVGTSRVVPIRDHGHAQSAGRRSRSETISPRAKLRDGFRVGEEEGPLSHPYGRVILLTSGIRHRVDKKVPGGASRWLAPFPFNCLFENQFLDFFRQYHLFYRISPRTISNYFEKQ